MAVRIATLDDPVQQSHLNSLMEALANSADAAVVIDEDLVLIGFNDAAVSLYGMIDPELGRSLFDADMVEETRNQRVAAMRRALDGQGWQAETMTERLTDGRTIHIEATGTPLTLGTGRIVACLTLARDVTEQTERHLSLLDQQIRLANVEIAGRIGTFSLDLESMVSDWSPMNAELHGFEHAARRISVEELGALIHPDDRVLMMKPVAKPGPFENDYRIVLSNGEIRVIHNRGLHFPGEGGHPGHLVGASLDVTDQRRYTAQMEFYATHDTLTGALNRRAIIDRLEAYLGSTRDESASGALLMVDLDHFKRHNDTYGHASGDALLVGIIDTIKYNLREEDVIGRLGGDEFLIVLVGTSPEQGELIAARLVEEIRRYSEATTPADTMPVTASIGVVPLRQGAQSAAELVDAADRGLYAAKQSGRDRWVVVSEI